MAYVLGGPQFRTGLEHANELIREREAPTSGGSISSQTLELPQETPAVAEVTTPATGGGSLSPTISAPVPSAPAAAPAPLSFQGYTPDAERIKGYESIFAPITQGLGQTSGKLSRAAEAFNLSAGPSRTFEGIGGGAILEQGLRAARDTQAFNEAKGLASASYAGPMDLEGAIADEDDISQALREVRDLQARSGSLTGLTGTGSLLQELYPQLTPGQLMAESQSLLGTPGYVRGARGLQSDVTKLFGNLGTAQSQAAALGGSRKAEEEAIQEAARGYLTGRQTGVQADLDKAVADEEARQAAVEAAYARFNETGDPRELAGLDESSLLGATSQQLATGPQATSKQAEEAFQAIMDKYKEIEEVPLLGLGISSHGREKLRLPNDWVKDYKKKGHTEKELKEVRVKAERRQKDLEAAGFSPGTAKRGSAPAAGIGQYGTYKPLYFADDLLLPDARNYATFDAGVRPSVQNVSTEEQRAIMNNINRLLEIPEDFDLQPPEEQLRHATLAVDAARYLEDEEKTLKAQTETLDDSRRAWQKKVAKARKQYRDNNTFFSKTIKSITGNQELGNLVNQLQKSVRKGDIKGAAKTGAKIPLEGAKMPVTVPKQATETTKKNM